MSIFLNTDTYELGVYKELRTPAAHAFLWSSSQQRQIHDLITSHEPPSEALLWKMELKDTFLLLPRNLEIHAWFFLICNSMNCLKTPHVRLILRLLGLLWVISLHHYLALLYSQRTRPLLSGAVLLLIRATLEASSWFN